MDLRQLKYFGAVIKNGGVRKASDAIHISQPALSRQLNVLEDELGVKLFLRQPGNREIVLTEFGKVVLKQSQIIADAISVMHNEIDRLKTREDREINIGMAGRAGAILLPKALKTFHARHSQVKVTLTTCPAGSVAELVSGKVDFLLGLHLEEVPDDSVEKMRLCTERFTVVASRNHPAAQQPDVSLKDLMDKEWVFWLTPGTDPSVIDRVLSWPGGRRPGNAIITDSPQAELALIRDENRLGIWSTLTAVNNQQQDLVTLMKPYDDVETDVVLAFRRSESQPDIIKELISDVVETTRSFLNGHSG